MRLFFLIRITKASELLKKILIATAFTEVLSLKMYVFIVLALKSAHWLSHSMFSCPQSIR